MNAQKRFYEKCKKDKVCPSCGRPSGDYVCCEKCRKEKRAARQARKAAGVCTECGGQVVTGRTRCEKHLAIAAAACVQKGPGLCAAGCPMPALPGRKCCADCVERKRRYRARIKDAAFNAYGGYACRCCNEKMKECLQIDHLNNDGAAHRKTFSSYNSTRFYRWLQQQGYPPGFQVLCANCNFAKARNGGICPHQQSPEAFRRS